MKRIFILTLIGVFAFTSFSFGAGAVCVEKEKKRFGNIKWIHQECTADDATAAFPSILFTGLEGYFLNTIETWPGSTAPTNNSDLTLKDDKLEDLLGTNGTDACDNATANTIFFSDGTKDYDPIGHSTLTGAITNNSVNSAIVNIRVSGSTR